ncbi:hypothetical protein DEU52_106138 [Ensifer adhaerens]|nr:hypothetical protein DEU52_106138 [Ensifer adhaerens]
MGRALSPAPRDPKPPETERGAPAALVNWTEDELRAIRDLRDDIGREYPCAVFAPYRLSVGDSE